MINDREYVDVPQNDREQINQVLRDYESDPAKGLTHGIQKDAIQNGTGARIGNNEPQSYDGWKFTFELLEINGNYALSFWDEGTTGLTGEILNVNEIEQWSLEDKLTPYQNLSRFLTRFESGGNVGPGAFGRGKLIFQAASKTFSIICDSLRYDDHRYVAFDRKIKGNRLKQPGMPYKDEETAQFIKEISNGVLTPLTTPGTRITILDLRDEVIKTIKNSFDESYTGNRSESFVKMIEETWWEIINKFNAKIFVKWGDKIKQVELSEPLGSIAKAADGENGWRIHKQSHLKVVVEGEIYKIKELKFALAPTEIDEDLRGIWLQRKRMKIGDISNGITIHHIIHKKLCGYVILDQELEDLVLKSEGLTHYSFHLGGRGIRQIREVVRTEVEIFQKTL